VPDRRGEHLNRTRHAVVAVLVALGAIGGTACGDEIALVPPTTDVPRIADHILLIGDSLLYQSATPVSEKLASAGWVSTIRGMPGAPIAGHPLIDWIAELEQVLPEQRPAVVVIELGTNDCNCNSIDDTIDTLMRHVAAERVYWIGVREAAPVPEDPAEINEALEDAAGRWPNLEFIPLDGALDEERDIGDDGVHFSHEGRDTFAALITDTVGPPRSPAGSPSGEL
jgi:hypothetical protein